MSPPKPPRLPSVLPDRDACPPKTATPPRGLEVYPQLHTVAELAVPHEVEDKVTGVLEGEELREERAKRPTDERIAHVEERVDDVDKEIKALRLETAQEKLATAKALTELTGTVAGMSKVVEIALKRDQASFDAGLQVKTADKLDKVAGRAIWRSTAAKWLGSGALGAGVLKVAAIVAHWLGVKL
jgi:hypothetical protein